MTPVYSICMCNYNMARTLEQAVTSVAAQLDDRFEIVLVDDGSSDNSVPIMRNLASQYSSIRIVPLKRDRNRKLGETRNISIREARGYYCLLHLDCDDVWDPHIVAWIEVFHQIEAAVGGDVLIAGRQIHMAQRDLLLRHGPYPNIFRGEDRNMYRHFSALGILWFLEHEVFRTRLSYPKSKYYHRAISHTIDHMTNDFRGGSRLGSYILSEMVQTTERASRLILFRLSLLPISWLLAKFKPPIQPGLGAKGFSEYREKHRGTFSDLMRRYNRAPDWSRLPASSRPIFDR
ncbi:MAG: glycosyltransferase family A protein [Rhodobacteraceae bacterium]|nr:glycosyltransferase family A protein [Paracoccaceae bacterium]